MFQNNTKEAKRSSCLKQIKTILFLSRSTFPFSTTPSPILCIPKKPQIKIPQSFKKIYFKKNYIELFLLLFITFLFWDENNHT